MSVASQPIAVAARQEHHAHDCGFSSFSPRNLFHGSPMSLKTGSFQNRFYPAGSPGHSMGPIAMPDFAPAAPAPWPVPDDLCRNYVCCGVALPDLHALVEHFESRHVEVMWPPEDTPSPDGTPAFDADDMDIAAPSPSPPATPESAFDSVRVDVACFRSPHQYTSSYSSLAGANGPQAAFNRYAGYADYSSALPGTAPSPSYEHEHHPKAPQPAPQTAVPPALLYSSSSSASPSPLTTPASSRPGTPVLPLHPHPQKRAGAPPSLTLTKPFRCPKPGCNKSYKQQNGLKYHLSHGQCNFAPRDPAVEALSEAERERRLRPFVCAVGAPKDCGRRYKNMNGLRYHYTHTGEHGARGLELLAQGLHPLPDLGAPSNASSAHSTPAATPVPAPRFFPQPAAISTVPVPAPVALAPSPLSPFPAVRGAWDDAC